MNMSALQKERAPLNKEYENGCNQSGHYTNGNGNGNGHVTLDSVNANASDKFIIDLDTVVEKYIQWAWELNKTKQQSKYDYDDLNITVNWDRVEFIHDEPKFEKTSLPMMPNTQTLFKTCFTNKTDLDQEYSFKTERTTRQSCNFSFLKGFSKEKEGGITFKLPQEILEIGGGVRNQQSVEFGKDETKEQEIKWGVDSIIRVPPHTCTTAELKITEQQFERNFTVDVKIKGKISYVFSSIKENNLFIKKLRSDIVEIFCTAIDKNWIPKLSTLFQVDEKKGNQHVKTTLSGRCKFRFGVSQDVTLQQQNLKLI